MITTDSVIDSLGGTKAVASALSLPLPTVSTWRRRGIPSKHWRPLVQLASSKGMSDLTLEALAEMRETADGART